MVSADEREGGERRILNFGHTIGHALEAETGYRKLLHGEAVGWGMIAAALIGYALDRTDSLTAQRIIANVFALRTVAEVEGAGPADSAAAARRQENRWRRAAFRPGNRHRRRSRWSTTFLDV